MPNPYVAPAPISADVGIVAALPLELAFFVDRLKKVRKYKSAASTIIEGELDGKVIAVIYSGVGRLAAKKATELLISGHRPSLIISAGFAGGLDPALPRGSVVVPSKIVDLDGKQFRIDPPDQHSESEQKCLVTVDSIARTPEEKAALRTNFQADLVDMETSAVATVCRDQGRRFLSVRVVSDDAGTELPLEIIKILNRPPSFQVGAAFRAIWKRPAAAKDLWALHSNAIEVSDQLAKGLSGVLKKHNG